MFKNLKSLMFIDKDGNNTAVQPIKKSSPSFPSKDLARTVTVHTQDVCKADIEKVIGVYEKGFDSLNKPGYDFYEMYKAITSTGENTPAVYKMAFTMATSQDGNVTKSSLLSDAKEYLDKLLQVHQENDATGNSNRGSIIGNKESDKKDLENAKNTLLMTIKDAEVKLKHTNRSLEKLDEKYQKRLHDINCKLIANDHAKEKIFNQINTIVNGITNNL